MPDDISEEELRAAYEEQLKQIRVEDVLVQTIVSLLNLGGRRAGLAQGTEGERDLDQVHLAIEGVRALFPIVEDLIGPDAAQLRNVLSELQMVYAREAPGTTAEAPPAQAAEAGAEQPGPAQSSGRLWVPGQ